MTDEELERQLGFAIRGVAWGEPVPDLARILRGRWRQVLAPVSEDVLRQAIGGLRSTKEVAAAMEAWLATPRRVPRATPVSPPAGDPRRPPRRAKQVNVRLYQRDASALSEAARLAGATPTELARWFIVSGSRRMVSEAQTAARRSSS